MYLLTYCDRQGCDHQVTIPAAHVREAIDRFHQINPEARVTKALRK